jgi:calpain, invertebrate
VLTLIPTLMDNLFVDKNIEQTYFTLRFFKDGKWKYVTIDNILPMKSNKLIYARGSDPNEFWVPLCEKAFAKLHGGYEYLEGGLTHEALVDLTGGVGYQIPIHPQDSNFTHLWENIQKSNSEEYLMGVMIHSTEKESELNESGLLQGHAYGILGCYELKNVKLIHIRNPWGKKEWKVKFHF